MNLLEGSNIPLHCNVCPKKPDFSDTSHLLTHIQSKGHLSNHYKVSVRANHDAEAKQLIADYNAWYQQHNLDDLMHERLSQKEKKTRSGSGATRRTSAAKSTSSRNTPTSSNNNATARRQSRLRTQQYLLDPQLNRRLVTDTLSRSVTPGNAFNFDPVAYQRFAPPPLQNWSFGSMHDSPLSNSIKQESIDSDIDDYEEDDDDDYEVMAPRRPSTRRTCHRQQNSGSVASFLKQESADEYAEEENNNIIAPKGIQWPGMSQFDSAPPEKKRKRNQKKHPSVIVALQRASEQIVPVEMVFDKDGALRKERDVNAPLSDDDLISGESAPESDGATKTRTRKRKMAGSRAALRKKDANSGRFTRGRGKTSLAQSNNGGPYYDGFGDDDDDDMTYRPRGVRIKKEKRSGVSIHRDNTGPEITFDQPAGMNYLTSGFRNPQPTPLQQGPPTFGIVPRAHSRQPSWGQMNTNFRPASSGYGTANNNYQMQGIGGFGHIFGNVSGNIGMPPAAQPTSFQNSGFMPNPLLSAGNNSGMWDMFGDDIQGFHFSSGGGTMDVKDGTMANPLFLKEDDEVTISAKGSEK